MGRGPIGLVSKSGTLTYQLMGELSDIGFTACLGVGGDPIVGTTLLEAKGGYTKEQRQVIMVVVSRKQYPLLEHEVLRIDPNAFIIVTDTDEVHGLGFTYEEDDYT